MGNAIKGRTHRVNRILLTLEGAEEKGVSVNFEKFKAEICIMLGVQQRKAEEYIYILETAGRININRTEGTIKLVKLAEGG